MRLRREHCNNVLAEGKVKYLVAHARLRAFGLLAFSSAEDWLHRQGVTEYNQEKEIKVG
jgi:hypothetical protein